MKMIYMNQDIIQHVIDIINMLLINLTPFHQHVLDLINMFLINYHRYRYKVRSFSNHEFQNIQVCKRNYTYPVFSVGFSCCLSMLLFSLSGSLETSTLAACLNRTPEAFRPRFDGSGVVNIKAGGWGRINLIAVIIFCIFKLLLLCYLYIEVEIFFVICTLAG